MKKISLFNVLLLAAAILFTGTSLTSCGSDGDENKSNPEDGGGDVYAGINNLPKESRFLVGTWEINYDGSSREIERWLTLSADGKAVMVTNRNTLKFSGSLGSSTTVWVPVSSEKQDGSWKYSELTDDFGKLTTDIAGWNELHVSGKLDGYWRGFNVGSSSYFNAKKMPSEDNAVNHMVQVGNTWIVCSSCNGSKKCSSCNGSGYFEGIKCFTCHGTGQKVTLHGNITCPDCNGLGRSGAGNCSQCGGSGRCPTCNGQGGHYE